MLRQGVIVNVLRAASLSPLLAQSRSLFRVIVLDAPGNRCEWLIVTTPAQRQLLPRGLGFNQPHLVLGDIVRAEPEVSGGWHGVLPHHKMAQCVDVPVGPQPSAKVI